MRSNRQSDSGGACAVLLVGVVLAFFVLVYTANGGGADIIGPIVHGILRATGLGY